MADRANAKPKATTEELLASSSEDEEEIIKLATQESSDGEDKQDGEDGTGNSPSTRFSTPIPNRGSRSSTPAVASATTAASATSKKKKSPPTVAPAKGKKGELNGSVSLLDDESQKEFKALAMEKRHLVDIKTKKETLSHEREVLNYRLEKLSKLKSIKEDYPDLSNDQIKQLFPELKDVVDIVQSLVAKSRYLILKVCQAFQNASS